MSIPRVIKYKNMYSGFGVQTLMTGADHNDIGKAVTYDTSKATTSGVYVKLAGDDERVIGRLDAVLDQVRSATPSADVVTVTVTRKGYLEVPVISSAASGDFGLGTYIIGAGDGEVKVLAASASTSGDPESWQYDHTNKKVIAYFR